MDDPLTTTKYKMKTVSIVPLAAALCLTAQTVSGQGGFVLFGDGAEAQKPEYKVVRPISAPYFHEDAFISSDLRAYYLNHQPRITESLKIITRELLARPI